MPINKDSDSDDGRPMGGNTGPHLLIFLGSYSEKAAKKNFFFLLYLPEELVQVDHGESSLGNYTHIKFRSRTKLASQCSVNISGLYFLTNLH